MNPIYLDHAAATPMHPEVLQAMLPYFTDYFGNPSSLHSFGRLARSSLNNARDTIAAALGCSSGELIFTSGGTESDNLALFGLTEAYGSGNKHIITTQIEHHAILHTCSRLEKLGHEVTYVPVDSNGKVNVHDVAEAIRPETVLISMMFGNNEVGTLQPVEEVGELARSRGILFHVDAVQALGLHPINLSALPVDAMSFSAHKLNGPKGIGALYLSKKVKLTPALYGGSQERKRRAGTENVASAAGFAKAVELAAEGREAKLSTMVELRDLMFSVLTGRLGESSVILNGHRTETLGHILNVSFPGCHTETLLMNLDLEGIAAASGSACSSGSLEISHVLKAMQLSDERTRSAIRFSFGLGNTTQEVEKAANQVAAIVERLRNR